jgi:hypothetical protein
MQYILKLFDSDGTEMMSSQSSDIDDIYNDVRHYKESPHYQEAREKELKTLDFNF